MKCPHCGCKISVGGEFTLEGGKDPCSKLEAIILNDGSEFRSTEAEAIEYERLFPAVDVPQTFREMRAWSLSHPTERKTKRGVRAFITRWLSREQNRS
jgi:hypothetical protein